MPTFVQEAETSWATSTTPQTTPAFDVLTNDLLVAVSVCSTASAHTLAVSDSTGLTWTSRALTTNVNNPLVSVWTAPIASDITGLTASFTHTGAGTFKFGANVLTIRDHNGVGAANFASQGAGTGVPSLALTTTADYSMIVVASSDGLAWDGASRVWRVGAGALTEQSYYTDGIRYTVYLGFHVDSGVVATQTLGLTAPTGQSWAIAAVEILDYVAPPIPEQTERIALTAAA